MANEYIVNKNLESIIIEFQKAKKMKDDKRVSLKNRKKYKKVYEETQTQLAHMFYILADNIIGAFGFKMVDKDDALQEGVMICIQKVCKFDPNRVSAVHPKKKCKAFNYMTTCIINHYRQLYRGAKNYKELQKKYFNFLVDKMDNAIMQLNRGGNDSVKFNGKRFN